MAQPKSAGFRVSSALYVGLALLLIGGGAALWKLRGPGGRGQALPQVELERQRVAAFDPTFDPGRPTGGISGVVYDGDGKPLDGAVIAVTRNSGKRELPTFSRPTPRTTVSAGGGRFQLEEILPGEYGVTATALAWAPARQSRITVQSAQTAEVILRLGKGGALFTGEVQDVGGGAVAGAKALLRGTGFMSRPGEPALLFQVVADEHGTFKVRLSPGDYDVTVSAEGYAPARDRLFLAGAQTRRYKLKPAARLAGRVLDRQSRQPVAAASVWLRLDRVDGYVDREATSDKEGRFRFDDLTAGGYVVLARAERSVGMGQTLSIGIAESRDDVEVLVETGRSIRGTVVDGGGKPLEGVRVAAGRSNPPFERPVFARSDAKGAFALQGLLPAKYKVNGWAEGGRATQKSESAQVTSKDVEGLRLTITQGLVVRGQVVDAAGKPVAEASVVGAVERSGNEMRFAVDRTTSDAAGKFALENLSPGKLTITAKHAERGNGKWGPEEVKPDQAAVTVKVAASASVAGVVKFEDGSPAPRVIVFAPPAQQGPMFGPPEQTTTDQQGRFLLTNLDQGRYMVMAFRDSNFQGGTPRSRQDVTLTSGEQKSGVELILPTAGKRIAGKVVDGQGQPVSGAVVTAGLEREGFAFRMPAREGAPSQAHAVSDHEGAFAIEDLQDGKYTVWAVDSAHADGERAGVTPGESNVVITLSAGASLSGVVKSKDGKPVSDYNLVALPGGPPGQSPDDRMRLQMQARMWSPTVQVHDPSGAFFLGRLSAGAYALTVTTADGQGGLLPITVASGEKKTGVTILMDDGVKLVGRVVDLEVGTPLEGVNVLVGSATSRQTALTTKDGSFTIEGLSPGRARVDFRLGDGETYVPEHIEIEVKPGQGTLDVGTIKKLKGSLRERRGVAASYGRVGFTVSLVDGKASVTGVRPGFPGDKAGLVQGELVLSVNGRSTEGYGNGALDYLAAGKVDQPLTVKVAPRAGGAPREVTMARVPIDFDPSRPGPTPPVAAGGGASK